MYYICLTRSGKIKRYLAKSIAQIIKESPEKMDMIIRESPNGEKIIDFINLSETNKEEKI